MRLSYRATREGFVLVVTAALLLLFRTGASAQAFTHGDITSSSFTVSLAAGTFTGTVNDDGVGFARSLARDLTLAPSAVSPLCREDLPVNTSRLGGIQSAERHLEGFAFEALLDDSGTAGMFQEFVVPTPGHSAP